jgi:hypothetical protein
MDLIKIVNVGDDNLTLNGNERITITPGGERIVPFAIAAAFFGDPRAHNEGKDKGRDDEIKRARTMWGFFPGFDTEEVWKYEKMPQYECFDMEGNRVHMILDDEEGEHPYGGAPRVDLSLTDNTQLARQVELLQAQIATLTAAIASQNAVPTPGADPISQAAQADEAGDSDPTGAFLPEPPKDEAPVTDDKPRTTRLRNG